MSVRKINLLYLAWGTAVIATATSLFFSEVLKLPPCLLCWHQRIAMYPLVFILAVGIIRRDDNTPYFALPMALLGWLIAAYHNLLYYKILPENAAPCLSGISCTTKQIEWLGFITIPLLSLAAFSVIIMALGLFLKKSHD